MPHAVRRSKGSGTWLTSLHLNSEGKPWTNSGSTVARLLELGHAIDAVTFYYPNGMKNLGSMGVDNVIILYNDDRD